MSAEYWKRRAEATLIANEMSILEYEKELRKAYEAAIRRITRELNSFYTKYAKDNNLALSDIRERLDIDNLKNFKAQAQEYLDEVKNLGLDPQYREYLRNLSAKAYVSKLQELETNIRHEIEKLHTKVANTMGQELKNNYEDSFYKTMFDVQKYSGTGVSFTAPGNKQLEKAIKTKWLDNNFSDRIWTNKKALLIQLNQLIPQEFVRGRGPKEIANDLAAKLNTSYNNAVRLVRTEMNNISNQATLDAYKESEVVEKYEFLATLDNRTSEICRELDGKVFKLSEAQTGVNLPPMHPYCRSTTIPWFPEDEFDEPSERIARSADGTTYKVPGNMTYKEWAEKYTTDAYYQRISGNVVATGGQLAQFDRYSKVLRELAPRTYEEFQRIKKEDPERWEQLKKQYRAINRYEIPEGVSASEVLQLDAAAWLTKRDKFNYKPLQGEERKNVKNLSKSGNVGVLKDNNEVYFSHSSVTKNDKLLYNSYTGDYEFIDRPKTSIFKTKYLDDDIDRTYDTEYRFFDFISKKYSTSDKASITILSEKHICESCLGVKSQFEKTYPNIKVTIISGKLGYNKDELGRKTYKYRNKKKKEENKK